MNSKTYGCEMPCKVCNRARCRGYKRRDEQRARDALGKRRPEVMARCRERGHEWYHSKAGQAWARAYMPARYAAKRDEILAEQRVRYQSDAAFRERVKVDTQRRRSTPEGRAAHNASNAKLKKTDRGRHLSRMQSETRRARKLSRVCDLADSEWCALVTAYGGCCAYWGETPDKIEIDHVIAIARGGAHTLSNVVPACKRCNLKKSAKSLECALTVLGVSPDTFQQWREAALRIVARAAA